MLIHTVYVPAEDVQRGDHIPAAAVDSDGPLKVVDVEWWEGCAEAIVVVLADGQEIDAQRGDLIPVMRVPTWPVGAAIVIGGGRFPATAWGPDEYGEGVIVTRDTTYGAFSVPSRQAPEIHFRVTQYGLAATNAGSKGEVWALLGARRCPGGAPLGWG